MQVLVPGQRGVSRHHLVLFGAQQNPYGRLIARQPILVVEKVQIELHLSHVSRIELARLKVEKHEASEIKVVEDEVDPPVPALIRQAPLALDEGESPTKLQLSICLSICLLSSLTPQLEAADSRT